MPPKPRWAVQARFNWVLSRPESYGSPRGLQSPRSRAGPQRQRRPSSLRCTTEAAARRGMAAHASSSLSPSGEGLWGRGPRNEPCRVGWALSSAPCSQESPSTLDFVGRWCFSSSILPVISSMPLSPHRAACLLCSPSIRIIAVPLSTRLTLPATSLSSSYV